ncbi:MAG: hypothetical protein WD271_14420 [Acidimicrobiia bacterium]
MTARFLGREGALYTHVDNKKHDVTDDVEWDRICIAAAWVTLDRYESAITSGNWEPEL